MTSFWDLSSTNTIIYIIHHKFTNKWCTVILLRDFIMSCVLVCVHAVLQDFLPIHWEWMVSHLSACFITPSGISGYSGYISFYLRSIIGLFWFMGELKPLVRWNFGAFLWTFPSFSERNSIAQVNCTSLHDHNCDMPPQTSLDCTPGTNRGLGSFYQ